MCSDLEQEKYICPAIASGKLLVRVATLSCGLRSGLCPGSGGTLGAPEEGRSMPVAEEVLSVGVPIEVGGYRQVIRTA
jgi:hypothetical protein